MKPKKANLKPKKANSGQLEDQDGETKATRRHASHAKSRRREKEQEEDPERPAAGWEASKSACLGRRLLPPKRATCPLSNSFPPFSPAACGPFSPPMRLPPPFSMAFAPPSPPRNAPPPFPSTCTAGPFPPPRPYSMTSRGSPIAAPPFPCPSSAAPVHHSSTICTVGALGAPH